MREFLRRLTLVQLGGLLAAVTVLLTGGGVVARDLAHGSWLLLIFDFLGYTLVAYSCVILALRDHDREVTQEFTTRAPRDGWRREPPEPNRPTVGPIEPSGVSSTGAPYYITSPPAAALGTLVVNGLILRIDRVLLRTGTFELTASTEVTREVTVRSGDECRIHDADGTTLGVLTLQLPAGPATARGRPDVVARLTLVLPLHLASFVGASAWPRPS